MQTDANGLLNMRARYYNPTICRFINPDPIGLAGGANWYAYANGNPINNLDPFGLFNLETFLSGMREFAGNAIQIVAATIASGGTATLADAILIAPSVAHSIATMIAGVAEDDNNKAGIESTLESLPSNWGQWVGTGIGAGAGLDWDQRKQLMASMGSAQDAIQLWKSYHDFSTAKGSIESFMNAVNMGLDAQALKESLGNISQKLSKKNCNH